MKSFKPILAPNEQPELNEIKYPILASNKLDGIRCIFYNGQILSRSLKPIVNKQLREKFEALRKYSEKNQFIFDGEIYSPELTFQQITSFVMTEDLAESKTVKKNGGVIEIPSHLKFYCFDMLDGAMIDDCYFDARLETASRLLSDFSDVVEIVKHKQVKNKEEVESCFEQALKNGCEGLILRNPQGKYKYGRGTLKEGIIYKVKPFVTFDAKIVDVVQSTEVNEDAEKKINELGRSVTSKKVGDRHLIEKASAFYVTYGVHLLKVTLAMTDEEKEEVWKNRLSMIGKWIEYKGMLVGAKDVPRHPVMIRFRKDKD